MPRAAMDRIAAIGTATPDTLVTQHEVEEILTRHYGAQLKPANLTIMQKVLRHKGIRQRHVAASTIEVMIDESPDERVARFTDHAIALSGEACRIALERAGVEADAVRAIVVNTCTGYVCPGISTYLVQQLSLASNTRAYDLVGGGCGGAIPNLELAAGQLRGCDDDGVVLSVSVEICTATFQMADDLSLIVSNAIFSDGAAAAVLWRRPTGLSIVDSTSLHAPEHREHIRYVHREGQLHNQLSARLPVLVKPIVSRVVETLLTRHHLRMDDIRHWAIHPGGEKVIVAIQEGLGLSDEKLQVTRDVLAVHGNMSSPTVWFELERILSDGVAPGEWIMAIAMGAGLSVHACLLRA